MGNTSSSYGHTAMPSSTTSHNVPVGSLPTSVSVISNPLGATIYLVGVNHVSQASCEDVKKTIEQVKPDTVFLEISRERFSSITYNGPLKLQPISLLSGATAFAQSLMARITFYQAALLDVRPGAEFRVALEEARKTNTNIILGDRVGDITWQRMMSKITLVDIAKALPSCLQYAREFTRLPTKDAMKQHLLDSMPNAQSANDPSRFLFPTLYPIMVTEKDEYMASVLRECPGKRVVAVVGAGHVAGITAHINNTDDAYLLRAELTRTSRLSRSPLMFQTVAAGSALTAVNVVVAAAMAKRLNQGRHRNQVAQGISTTLHRPYRGTIPITLLLLTLELGSGALWLSNEWLRFHTSVTQAVVTYRDEEETRRALIASENSKSP